MLKYYVVYVSILRHVMLCHVVLFFTRTNDYTIKCFQNCTAYVYCPKRYAIQIWTTRQQQKTRSWLLLSLSGTKTSYLEYIFIYYIYIYISIIYQMLLSCLCLRPENRPSVFAFFLRLGCGGCGGNNVQCTCGLCTHFLVRCILYIFSLFSCSSMHIMLRWTRVLFCGGYRSCYAGHVFCSVNTHPVTLVFYTSVNTLHLTLDRSSVLLWIHFSSYARHVFCTWVDTLHVTLDASSVLLART